MNMPLWVDLLDDDGNFDDGEDFDLDPFSTSWIVRAVDEIIAEEDDDDPNYPF